MKSLLSIVLVVLTFNISAQSIYNSYQEEMNEAYAQFPDIPKGILEAVSFSTTHFSHITKESPKSCFGLPHVYGVMGLTEDGEGYFKNNLLDIARYSGYSVQEIKNDPQTNILSYASAYQFLMDSLEVTSLKEHDQILEILSEIPLDNNTTNNYALSSHVYSVFSFLKDDSKQSAYNFPNHELELIDVFGENNLEILSSPVVDFVESGIQNQNGTKYEVPTQKTAEYGPALWVATPTCNYSSRNGTAISAITIHTIQGTYAGAISWAQNCNANVSYHYVVRSSDGQITQMVLEADKGWHVGAENPYTIGIEHDGYVSDPSWYTPELYNASADLCRDITQSGYGINPLRTFFGEATVDVNVLGGCTKIKGHQHYPNNTHTDPGVNWDWEGFYKLINNNPSYNSYTAGSGNLYDSGGPSENYTDDERILYLIEPTGAGTVSITFNSFDIELDWDYLFIYDGATPSAPLLGKYTGTTSPGTITSTGGSLLLEFRSDCATTSPGWDVSYTSTLPDNNAPTTLISTTGNWKTTDFSATFTDADNVAVADSFYQVADYNGIEWKSNPTFGFFNDEFDQAISPNWTSALGTWATNAGALEQTDEAESNSNLYADLTQTGTESILYNWQGQINGSGTNRRAGMHFFCDDASQTQRGNSYMVYWRVDQDKCQIYEVNANSITLMTDDDIVVNENTWYDFKILFNPQTGSIEAYLDDVLVSQWTDPSPLTSGNSISLRTGNCIGIYEDLKVYKSRNASELITIGSSAEIRYQNANPSTPTGRITSLAKDDSDNWSVQNVKTENIDWTAPTDISMIDDGNSADIDTTNVGTELSANWSASNDTHSDVVDYWYAIGTTAGGTDIVNWTSNGTNTFVTHTGLNLVAETIYYFTVKSENGAGLESTTIDSDGQRYIVPSSAPIADFYTSSTTICAGESIQLTNNSTDATSYIWSTTGGTLSSTTNTNPTITFGTTGSYTIDLEANGPGGIDIFSQSISVVVVQPPVASASASSTQVTLPSATVSFTNNSMDATSYAWTFGDGNTSSLSNPSHTYISSGFYTVMLTASNGTCTDNSTTLVIEVLDPTATPVANFSPSNTTICSGESIQLTNSSTDATSYAWSTSGGTISSTTDANPTIDFTSSGTYTVDLTANGPGGTDISSQVITITVMQNPVASGTPSSTSLTLPSASVSFTNSSTNSTSYFWDFGDGNTSVNSDPINNYTSSGTYSVMLIASNGTCDDDTTYFTINVADSGTPPNPAAIFSIPSTTVCQGESIQLSNNSLDATSYVWTTSGGTLSSTTAENPTIDFATSGSYTIDLTANGPGGTDVSSQTISVTIEQNPTASATTSATTVTLPSASVSFTNTSSNATSYFWDFGDGNTSTNENPTYSYSAPGTYTASLTASNGVCSDASTTFSITVEPAPPEPNASFTVNDATICAGDSIQLTNNSSDATTYVWSSNGGTILSPTDFEPLISFTTSGTYNVTLTAIGVGGTDVATRTVVITTIAAPISSAMANNTSVQLPNGNVTFTNLSFNATGYFWDFGDGNTSNDTHPFNEFTSPGVYDVMLVASNGNCQNDTSYIPITVIGFQSIGDEESKISVEIFPNPSNGVINLSYILDEKENVTISLFDITGKQIWTQYQSEVIGKQISSFDLKHLDLPNGMYSIRIATDKHSVNKIIFFQ